ncbi:MAG: MFS transporter [Anaerolineae bacterium]|nr:MFS transporter [Anaerolineae bacterium]
MNTEILKSSPAHTLKMYQTIGYYAAFVALGLSYSTLGPTLTNLAEQTQVGLTQISYTISVHALGYLLGASIGGRLYDRVRGNPLMALMMLLIAIMMAVVPVVPLWWGLILVFLLMGMFQGALDVGGNTLLVWVHREQVPPYMNALHFFFGVGAFLAPIVVAQVIAATGGIAWAYWILALVMLPVAAGVWRQANPTSPTEESDNGNGSNILLLGLIAAFFFLYVGAEGSFGNWIATYAKASQLGDAVSAAYLTSAFWGALTAGRLLSIPLTTRFTPHQVLTGDLAGCLIGAAVLLSWPTSLAALWTGTLLVGFSMASIFPTMISFAERQLTITGKTTSWFFVGGSLGGITLPWLIGQLFESVGPRVTIALISGDLLLAVVVFVSVLLYARSYSKT